MPFSLTSIHVLTQNSNKTRLTESTLETEREGKVKGMLRILIWHDFRCNGVELTEPCCCSTSAAGPGTVSHTVAVQCTVLRKKKKRHTVWTYRSKWHIKLALDDWEKPTFLTTLRKKFLCGKERFFLIQNQVPKAGQFRFYRNIKPYKYQSQKESNQQVTKKASSYTAQMIYFNIFHNWRKITAITSAKK